MRWWKSFLIKFVPLFTLAASQHVIRYLLFILHSCLRTRVSFCFSKDHLRQLHLHRIRSFGLSSTRTTSITSVFSFPVLHMLWPRPVATVATSSCFLCLITLSCEIFKRVNENTTGIRCIIPSSLRQRRSISFMVHRGGHSLSQRRSSNNSSECCR